MIFIGNLVLFHDKGRIMKRASLLLAGMTVLAMGGCISTGGDFGSVVTQGQKEAIVAGKTTRTEILRELGNPDQKIDLGNGKAQFSYIKEKVRTKGAILIPASETTSQYEEFWIVFDKDVVAEKGERPTTKTPNYFK
jgi:hypothetical protein